MTDITPAQKRACIKRELGMRRSVYPHLVSKGKMRQAEADHEIAVMEAVLADYPEERAPDLFAVAERTRT